MYPGATLQITDHVLFISYLFTFIFSVLGRIPFETFQEEEYLEQVFRTPPIPVQMEQK